MEGSKEKPVTSRETKITHTETKYKIFSLVYFLLEVVTQYFHSASFMQKIKIKNT